MKEKIEEKKKVTNTVIQMELRMGRKMATFVADKKNTIIELKQKYLNK